ncbi:hypothetical protein V1509DRAFT_630470 [Lipomyces kononenkoae]
MLQREVQLQKKSNAWDIIESLPARPCSRCMEQMEAGLIDEDTQDETRKTDQWRDELPLQFITITDLIDAKKPDLATRRIVRAQARKSAYRASTQALTTVTGKSEPSLKSKFKLSSWQGRSSKKQLEGIALPSVISNFNHLSNEHLPQKITSEIATINVLPIPMIPMTQELLHFYYFDLHTNSFALNPEGDWFNTTKTDPAALHAFLSTIAVLRNLHLGITDATAILYHRAEAVRFINRDLADADRRLSDVLIAAVAVLVNAEAVESNFERASIHMRGLVALVQLRGGLQSFKQWKTLQRVITWADFCFASTWRLPLSFPLLKSLSSPVLPSDPLSAEVQMIDIAEPHSRQLLKLLMMLRSISNAISAFPDVGGDRVAISNSIYLVEYNLISLQLTHPDQIEDKIDISECVSLAALLYLHLAIRELPSNAHRHHRLIEKLFHSLPHKQDLAKMMAPDPTLTLLFWAFFIGIVSVTDPARHAILVKRMTELRIALHINEYAKFARTLKMVLWIDHFSEPWSITLWGEMESQLITVSTDL